MMRRQKTVSDLEPGLYRAPLAKLTASEVAQIRTLAADKWIDSAGTEWTEREVAEFFGETVANIRLIVKRVTWKVA
jgi:hypothetical protein